VQSYQTSGDNVILAGNLNSFEFSDGYVDVTGIIDGLPAATSKVVDYGATNTTAALTDFITSVTANSRYNIIERGNSEVLEHIPNDLDVIKQWKAGAFCVCSVPNFDADTHERFFGREAEVRARYGNLLDITRIVRLRKPALSDISLANYVRAVRWNRYRPRRLAELLGLATFDAAGGWFVFVGTKR